MLTIIKLPLRTARRLSGCSKIKSTADTTGTYSLLRGFAYTEQDDGDLGSLIFRQMVDRKNE